MAPGGKCLSQCSPLRTKKRDRLLWHPWEAPDTPTPMRPDLAGCRCRFQVRKLRARKEFCCPGRRCMDLSRYLRGTAMLGRRGGDGCAVKKGPKGSIKFTNAEGHCFRGRHEAVCAPHTILLHQSMMGFRRKIILFP